MSSDRVSLTISKKLFDAIQHRVENSRGEFSHVKDYVEFVLTEVLEAETRNEFQGVQDDALRQRLKQLGYL